MTISALSTPFAKLSGCRHATLKVVCREWFSVLQQLMLLVTRVCSSGSDLSCHWMAKTMQQLVCQCTFAYVLLETDVAEFKSKCRLAFVTGAAG